MGKAIILNIINIFLLTTLFIRITFAQLFQPANFNSSLQSIPTSAPAEASPAAESDVTSLTPLPFNSGNNILGIRESDPTPAAPVRESVLADSGINLIVFLLLGAGGYWLYKNKKHAPALMKK